MILDLINDIEKFIKLSSNHPKKNLLEGRKIQTKIHQSAAFYLPHQVEDTEAVRKIEKIAEQEQDSLFGIEANLLKLLHELKELR